MGESLSRRAFASKDSKEQRRRFGTIVLALWPDKPALVLSQRINDLGGRSTERAANFYINGKRKISARCIQVIVNEMLE